jgi:hypothetical protein
MVRGTQLTTKLKDLLVKYPHYLTNWHKLCIYIYALYPLQLILKHPGIISTSRQVLCCGTWHGILCEEENILCNLVTHQLGLSTNEIGWTSWKDCTKISASGLQLMIPLELFLTRITQWMVISPRPKTTFVTFWTQNLGNFCLHSLLYIQLNFAKKNSPKFWYHKTDWEKNNLVITWLKEKMKRRNRSSIVEILPNLTLGQLETKKNHTFLFSFSFSFNILEAPTKCLILLSAQWMWCSLKKLF